jgi:hypothetical protein
MAEKYLIKNLEEFTVTVHGLPDPEKFVKAFILEGGLELADEGNNDKENSDIPNSQ